MVAHASVASSKPKVKLNSHEDTCLVGDNCLVIHDHNRPVHVYSHAVKDGCRSAKTDHATVGYQVPQSGQNYILMINQAIFINGLENPVLELMQCCLNGVYVSKVPKFLADSLSEATHEVQLTDPFDAALLTAAAYNQPPF